MYAVPKQVALMQVSKKPVAQNPVPQRPASQKQAAQNRVAHQSEGTAVPKGLNTNRLTRFADGAYLTVVLTNRKILEPSQVAVNPKALGLNPRETSEG